MNEKSYGGNNGIREHANKKVVKLSSQKLNPLKNKSNKTLSSENSVNLSEIESYKKAGEIAQKIREYCREFIKPDMLLIEIAKKIHKKIEELGAEPAFPVNLSIDDIAAHYHPTLEDETKASGLLKVDLGIHINGFIADTALSLDLTPEKKYKELIEASEEALKNALATLEKNPTLDEIGKTIQNTIESKGFSPIINLSGHSLDKYRIHAGVTIPNYSNKNQLKLEKGAYAIEPFATTGEGRIYEGPSGNIYSVQELKTPRSPTARKILEYVWNKYKTLPFSLRELQEEFGNISRIALRELKQQNIIHEYPQLIEKAHKPVSQAEHTLIKTHNIIITTKK
jgi:methionyl aminopeptidase